jgi:UPF0755 protein
MRSIQTPATWSLYGLAYRAQQDRLEQAWQARNPDLPYATPYQALTMASIIEKETGRVQERPLVAAVFVNRQRLGMPLQTDPTVIYGLGADFTRTPAQARSAARHALQYVHARRFAADADLPSRARGDRGGAASGSEPGAVYFVSRGDGTSEFSTTLAEHNRAVDRFQRSVAHHDAQ